MNIKKHLYTLLMPLALASLIWAASCSSDDTVFEERCTDKAKGTWIVDAVYIKQTQDEGAKLQEDNFNDWADFELTIYTDGSYIWDDGSGIIEASRGDFTFTEDCTQVNFEGTNVSYTANVNYLSRTRFEFTMAIEGFKGDAARDFYFRLVPRQ